MQKFSKVFILMVAMLALAYCAVSCKVNVDDEPTLYTVTVASSIEHGKVSIDKSSAGAGTTIKLTATADEGYQLDSYSVKDASSNAITVTDGTFTMPKSNVTVSATFTKTAATLNQEAADAVITKITAIGTVAYTTESKTKIDDARTAYDELTGAQKALIPAETLAVLTKAETDYNALKTSADEAAANQAAADAVIAKINAIGTVAYTTESKTKIDDARTAYDELTGAQKALIPAETLALLTAAETKYAELKAAAEQQTAGSISYATTTVEKTTADGAFTNELTKTGDGTVSYSSSDANVATVNATTGEVTIVGAGTATITATVTDSDTYTYASKTASYTVSVTVTVQSETLLTTITGAGDSTSSATSANISYSTEGVATLTFSGSVKYTPTWGWWGGGLTATVNPADGYTITKCVFYDNNDHSATDIEAPFVVETNANKIPQVNDTPIDSQSKGITKIEVYGYVNP